jgi:hypothetical protein
MFRFGFGFSFLPFAGGGDSSFATQFALRFFSRRNSGYLPLF